jgi:hypothetical protein
MNNFSHTQHLLIARKLETAFNNVSLSWRLNIICLICELVYLIIVVFM